MAITPDVGIGVLSGDDPQKQIESVVKQVNENFRLLSNESRTNVVKDDSGYERLLIGYDEAGFTDNVGIKVSQRGVNVLEATDDQLVMSSEFNMHKIIASGRALAPTRTGSITLDSTNIGYRYQVVIDTGIASSSNTLSGELMLRVYSTITYSDYAEGGVLYDDGTNVICYKSTYSLDRGSENGKINVEFRLRRTAGSLSFLPSSIVPTSFYWEICNNTQTAIQGGGGGGSSGKYYFFDTTTIDADGAITSALSSTTVEFASTWPYYPYLI